MSLSSVELWQRISAAGLAAPLICRSWAADALQGLQPSDAANAEKILEQLVRLGRLTDYQADLVAGRSKGEFKRGAWTLLRPVAVPLWDGWFEAVKSPTDKPSWLRWISSEALTELKDAAPSLPRGLRLAQVKGANLQTVFVPELIEQQLQLQVSPLQGFPLPLAVQRDPSIATQAANIVRQVAEALRPLHAAQLAHGRVMPDRIFCEANSVTLARDPICNHTGSLAVGTAGVIENGLTGLSPAQFMAPEFLAPGQLPTASSDIYSLGCVWWWLVTGKPLVAGSTLDKQLARQAEASIALPKDCSLPPPLVRCLQHCLAKNLPARFATADALCNAIDAALASIAKGQVPRSQAVVAKPSPATKPAEQISAPKTGLAAKPVAKPASTNTVVPAIQAAVATKSSEVNATTDSSIRPAPIQVTPVQVSLVQASPIQAEVVEPSVATPVAVAANTKDAVSSLTKAAQKVTAKPAPKPAAAKSGGESNAPTKAAEPTVALKQASIVSENVPDEKAPTVGSTESSAIETAPEPEFVVPVAKRKPGGKTKRKGKRKPANKWTLTAIGGLVAVCLLLGVLIASGAFKSTKRANPTPVEIAKQPDVTNTAPVEAAPVDPRTEVYRIVESGKDLLWAPPTAPRPIELDMLPPGGQMFVTLHPQRLMSTPTSKSLLAAFNDDLSTQLEAISKRAGVPFDAIERVTIAFFAENEVVSTCMRVQLVSPQSLTKMKTAWGSPSDEKVDSLTLLSNAADSYFIAEQPLSDSQSVTAFSVGPKELMREAAENRGAAGPLVSQVEKLWEVSDSDADFSLLVATPFLFSEGKSLLAMAPARLASRLREALEVDSRAALIQTRLEPNWYLEAQLIGTSERESPRLNEQMHQRIAGAAAAVEEWFVSEQPHPYWRSLAIRYPQMLRVLSEQSRFGIERGAAVMNAYLPSEAAGNILLSSWIAAQSGATLISDMPQEMSTGSAAKPLTIDEYLARPIKLSFDQEPIETALRLVGEEANANLPAGSPQLRFALDGGAFERAGITRNQQLRDFKHVNLPMRDALTAIAKRGNPVPTVKDTREVDQRLIWVVRDDPEQPGKQMISLTTRTEAAANNIALPIEFAPAN